MYSLTGAHKQAGKDSVVKEMKERNMFVAGVCTLSYITFDILEFIQGLPLMENSTL